MTDRNPYTATASWSSARSVSPPPPPVAVVVTAVIIGLLLLVAGVDVAVKTTAPRRQVAHGLPPSSPSTPDTAPPGSSAVATPPPSAPHAAVAPVRPLVVPPVIAAPVVPHHLNLSTATIAALVNPSVVDIDTRLAYQHAIAAGTGIVLSSNGVVLTNNHVIDGATTIGAVSVGTGRSYTAHVLGVDPSADVAVLQLDGASGLPTALTNEAAPVVAGDPVVAIGNAGGAGGTPSVTMGTVEATDESIIANDPAAGTSEQLDGLIETSATLQPGDSGGPLVNGAGQVIGMDTAASVSNQASSNVSFAIPIGPALTVARQIQAGQASGNIRLGLPPFLGLEVMTGATAGGRPAAVVSAVVAGSPAAGVGVVPGSVIVAVNGQSVDSAPALTNVLRQFRPGSTVTVAWLDQPGASHSARVTLGTGPAD